MVSPFELAVRAADNGRGSIRSRARRLAGRLAADENVVKDILRAKRWGYESAQAMTDDNGRRRFDRDLERVSHKVLDRASNDWRGGNGLSAWQRVLYNEVMAQVGNLSPADQAFVHERYLGGTTLNSIGKSGRRTGEAVRQEGVGVLGRLRALVEGRPVSDQAMKRRVNFEAGELLLTHLLIRGGYRGKDIALVVNRIYHGGAGVRQRYTPTQALSNAGNRSRLADLKKELFSA